MVLMNRDIVEWEIILVCSFSTSEKQRKCRKPFFLLLQVENLELIKKGPSVSVRGICIERGSFMIVLDEVVSTLNYEKDVLFRMYVEGRVLKGRDSRVFTTRACSPSFPSRKSALWWLFIVLQSLI